MKIFNVMTLLLVLVSFCAQAESIDCKGTVYNKPVYISTAPVAPYSQFVKRECTDSGLPIAALDGDFYFVYNVNSKYDSSHPCDISGSMWELQTVSQKDDGTKLEYQLLFCRKNERCEAIRGLRIQKSSGEASFFNILKDGTWLLVSQSLSCSIKN